MKYFFLVLFILIGCDTKSESPRSSYFGKLEVVSNKKNYYDYERFENKEVICYSQYRGGMHCFKKEMK